MDLARIEFFLDDGWCLIGEVHQWLSRSSSGPLDTLAANQLIHGLQKMWSAANDLGASQIARTSLALELMLERFCAGTLEFSVERLEDFTRGVGCLQEMLLGLEATREEPNCPDLEALQRIERHTHEANWAIHTEITDTPREIPLETFAASGDVESADDSSEQPQPDSLPGEEGVKSIERTLLRMLEQFVIKLDDICQQLHSRMMADQTPYVTTTSRLEHLAQVTRGLVDQMLHQPGYTTTGDFDLARDFPEASAASDDLTPQLIVAPQSDEFESIEIAPSAFAAEMDKISRDLEEMLPDELFDDEIAAVATSPYPEFQPKSHQVLIVEESLFYRHLLKTSVAAAGHEARTCNSVSEAFAALEESHDYLVALIDASTEPETVQSIKRLGLSTGIRIVGLTTPSSSPGHQEIFDDCVSKAHPQKLIDVLQRILDDAAAPTLVSV
jgi:CheY-like chemotaxis protein